MNIQSLPGRFSSVSVYDTPASPRHFGGTVEVQL